MKKKGDIIFILTFVFIALFFFIFVKVKESKSEDLIAKVYHDNQLVIEIDLSVIYEEKEVTIYLEDRLVLVCNHNKIRIKENNCMHKTCINQGYTSSSSKPLICIPNRIYIKIEGKSEVDIEL